MSVRQPSQTSSAEATPTKDPAAILAEIKRRGWWQGSVISAADLALIGQSSDGAELWVVVSQTCNLYNPFFDRVPVFELVGASQLLDGCSAAKAKGDDPRILHVEATGANGVVSLVIDIQARKWLPRTYLAKLSAPRYSIQDPPRADWATEPTWLDNLAGWLGRSYTRVALPDEFNEALSKSKLLKVLDEKVTKDKDGIYGIYLSVERDSEEAWEGALGLMPPPYNLGVTLIVKDDQPRATLREKLIKQIFKDEVEDPGNQSQKTTRAALAQRYQIRIAEIGIEVRGMSDVNLAEVRQLIRYTMVDYLSSSSFAAPQ